MQDMGGVDIHWTSSPTHYLSNVLAMSPVTSSPTHIQLLLNSKITIESS